MRYRVINLQEGPAANLPAVGPSAYREKTMTDIREFVTVAEASSLTGLSRDTLWRRIREGRLSAVRAGERKTFINRADVLALIQPV